MDLIDIERLQAALREIAEILDDDLNEGTVADLWERMEDILDACRDLWEED